MTKEEILKNLEEKIKKTDSSIQLLKKILLECLKLEETKEKKQEKRKLTNLENQLTQI